MYAISELPTRAQFIRDRLSRLYEPIDSGWTPTPTDTGVMHGPADRRRCGSCAAASGVACDRSTTRPTSCTRYASSFVGQRIPGTTRTV